MTNDQIADWLRNEREWLAGFAHALMDHAPEAGRHLLERLAWKRDDHEDNFSLVAAELESRK